MNGTVESRPERALYNVEVTLRMVDQVLAELGGSPAESAAGAPTAGATDTVSAARWRGVTSPSDLAQRVAHALMLVERLGAIATDTPERHVHEGLRRELRALLRQLHERVPQNR